MSRLRVPVSARDHVLGGPNPLVTLVEYGDYECPHCAAAHPNVRRVHAQFGDKLAVIYRHFPITEVHPHALAAAQTAEFAGEYGQFWEMHEAIFLNQRRLNQTTLFALASRLGLSQFDLRDAINRGRYLDKINDDFIGGVRSGVNATPTFFVEGERYNGAYSWPNLITAVSAAMREGTRSQI